MTIENTPRILTVPVAKRFLSDNWFALIMLGVAGTGLVSVLSNVAEHREQVQTISVQNAGCIYLESSKLGEGQHYMICNGQIALKRVADGEQTDPEQALEEAIPDVSNAATPTPVADKK
jgi:hypothetical protein